MAISTPGRSAITPVRIVLLACLVAVLSNGILLGAALLSVQATERLGEQVEALRSNLDELRRQQLERRQDLEFELQVAEEHVRALEGALPPVDTPIDVFRTGYQLADDPSLQVLSIHWASGEIRETAIGPVEVSTHRIVSDGTLQSCLDYIARLEASSLGLGVQAVVIHPTLRECSLDVVTLAKAE